MSDLLPCPFCGEAIRHAHYGLIHPERDGECVLAGMTWDAEHYAAAWNTRVASHPVTSSPVVSHKTGNMSDNDLIERVARDIADALGDNLDYAFTGKSDWITHRGETPAGYRDVNQPYRPDYIDAAIAAIAIIDLPAIREAAARAALEAAVIAYQAETETWLQLPMRGSCSRQGTKAIRAIDPAAFRGGEQWIT